MSRHNLMRYFYGVVFLCVGNVINATELLGQPKEERHELVHACLRVNRGFLKNNASRFDLSGTEQAIYTDLRTKQSTNIDLFKIIKDNEDEKTDTESISDNGEIDIECSAEPMKKHTELAVESLPLRFDSLAKIIIIPNQSEYIYNPDLFRDELDPPGQILWIGKAQLTLHNGSRVTSAMRPFQTKEEDQALLQILDDEFLANQIVHMPKLKVTQSIRAFLETLSSLGFTQQAIGEMFDVSQPTVSRFLSGKSAPKILRNVRAQMTTSTPLITSALIDGNEKVPYTGIDNLLFEKAYTHMIDILQQFSSLISELQPAASATSKGSFTNPRQLFCTKKLYLMAMIAFLNSCHEAVASEEKVSESKPDEDIVYQWDLSGPSSSQQPLQPSGTVADVFSTQNLSFTTKAFSMEHATYVSDNDDVDSSDEESPEQLEERIRKAKNPAFRKYMQKQLDTREERKAKKRQEREERRAFEKEVTADLREREKEQKFMGYDEYGDPYWTIPTSKKFDFIPVEEKVGRCTFHRTITVRKEEKKEGDH